MVGETTARPFARNPTDLLEMFKENLQNAKRKKVETQKMISELERELSALDSEENAWDAAIFELEHMGQQSGPKRKKRKDEEEEEEEEEEERK